MSLFKPTAFPVHPPDAGVRESKRVVIIQSNYIPWKGYFDLLNVADEVVLYDDAQYTIRDWRNRNRIKTVQGPVWLTIPVRRAGRFGQRIRDARIERAQWRAKHWRSLQHSYTRAPFFKEYRHVFEDLYLGSADDSLSSVNYSFICAICSILGIQSRVTWSWAYELVDGKTERLVGICEQLGATEYVSGPAARAYLDESLFHKAGIAVRWTDYHGYPEYDQLYPPFEHGVSVLDLLFTLGPRATTAMKSFAVDAQ